MNCLYPSSQAQNQQVQKFTYLFLFFFTIKKHTLAQLEVRDEALAVDGHAEDAALRNLTLTSIIWYYRTRKTTVILLIDNIP